MTALTEAPNDEHLARVMLAYASEPGDRVTGRLVNDFGASETVQLALVAPGADGSEGGAVDHWRKRVSPRLNMDRARDALETTEQIGAQLLTPDDSKWPEEMNILGDHAPLALWVLGNAEHLSAEASVGIIGARAATGYGSHVAGELADGVAEQGQVVVSGGSYGIDAVAHRAALMAGGPTVAVLPGALDRLYPSGHKQLFERIATTGALVSEVPPEATPTRWRLLQRGRVIAALSSAVVVVEAGVRSSALSVAAQAAEFGRCVGAVPGPITSASSAGSHRLMRDGIAEIVTRVDDVTMMLQRAGAHPGRTLTPDTASAQVSSSSSPARTTGPSR
ncbi:MAG: DNA-processing protein DprA [Flaviflexus sp.]|nr:MULTISPECIES: DNA-processing protein DprA [Micrococcales]MDN5754990.1 DNA-processing protein DprA [Micrococcaceae bacterium]MDN5816556.1 DNA-processing protein DprA [Yaniella sp.]MDN6399949.1 DNA-processing protein DprA [Brachybacterium sp.]